MVRLVGVESAHLSRLFRRFLDISPHRYLLQQKMVIAAEKLVGDGCLVKEAARTVRMDDPYHFSRVFKQVHGQSPTAFKQALGRH
ncbi:MAG: helix-turn-helix transcriptional regulator [Candidatus Synoicihabitans palmerolidicus]|nr:helix-turn-helix transcriptional regulator [Candidatus Synoicihabitans palmerolidicus]